jgi:peptidoglycan hydrolase-like protein with peptidoglycan-binding domain
VVLLFAACFLCAGCSLLERILDREGFEERRLFGDSYQYTSKIIKLQRGLREIGYNLGVIDGKIGDKTRSAVKTFQKDYGLKVTGYVDKKTWVELNKAYEKEYLSFEKITIKKVQTALKNAGFDPGL